MAAKGLHSALDVAVSGAAGLLPHRGAPCADFSLPVEEHPPYSYAKSIFLDWPALLRQKHPLGAQVVSVEWEDSGGRPQELVAMAHGTTVQLLGL